MSEQTSFYGSKEHTLDAKNRVILSSIFRDRVNPDVDGKTFFITRGLDGCIYIYTAARWKELTSRISKEPFTKEAARDFQREFFGNAAEIEHDKTGRILIPSYLKTKAGLKKELIVKGVGDHIEIWDAETWREKERALAQSYENLAEELFKGDIEF